MLSGSARCLLASSRASFARHRYRCAIRLACRAGTARRRGHRTSNPAWRSLRRRAPDWPAARAAQERDLGMLHCLAERTGENQRIGREHEWRIMVLRDADPIEAELFRTPAVLDLAAKAPAGDLAVADGGGVPPIVRAEAACASVLGANSAHWRDAHIGACTHERCLHAVLPFLISGLPALADTPF